MRCTASAIAGSSLFFAAVRVGAFLAWLSMCREARADPPGRRAKDSASDARGDLPQPSLAPADVLVTRGARERRAVRGNGGGEASLSVLGFGRESAVGRREVGGMLVASVPFDRIARGRSESPPRAAGPSPPSSIVPAAVLAASRSPAAAPLEASVAPAPAEALPRDPANGGAMNGSALVSPGLARACVAAAWRAAGLGEDDARIEAIAARARLSALLPEARVRLLRAEDERLSADAVLDEASRLRDTAGQNLAWEARLTWRFDRVLYADDEPSLERLRLERQDARTRMATRTLEALFHWQRAWTDWTEAAAGPPDGRDPADAFVRAAEAEAILDVLTRGWFAPVAERIRARSGGGASKVRVLRAKED